MTDLIVTTEQGKVRGKTGTDYYGGKFYSFLGIPYAKPPVDNLRFKEPQPPESWDGIFDATRDGPACPSLFPFNNKFLGKEDNCLNLNIFTKQLQGSAPVMVFIHGGGFVCGSNGSKLLGPKHLMTAGVVLVVINYRLGILGFLSLEDRSLKIPGNNGLKDQVVALKWVQQNIQNFGGDPNNVTIFGSSAGAASVQYLMLSHLAKGLFHKCIMQSGSVLNPWARGRNNALDIAKVLGYDETSEKDILEKLMKEKVENIAKAQSQKPDVFLPAIVRPYGPVVEYEHENAFLSKDPVEIMKSGNYNKVPLMIGYNSLEGLLFCFVRKMYGVSVPLSLECDVPHYLNIPKSSKEEKEVAESIKKFYYKDEEISEENIIKRYELYGDSNFVYGILKTAQLMSPHHPVYLYKNSLDGPLNFGKKMSMTKYGKTWIALTIATTYLGFDSLQNLVQWSLGGDKIDGVSHGDEICYFFSGLLTKNYAKGSQEDVCIQKFLTFWTNFAKSSNPTPKTEQNSDQVIWESVEQAAIEPIFNIDFKVELLKQNLETEVFKFWDDIQNQ